MTILPIALTVALFAVPAEKKPAPVVSSDPSLVNAGKVLDVKAGGSHEVKVVEPPLKPGEVSAHDACLRRQTVTCALEQRCSKGKASCADQAERCALARGKARYSLAELDACLSKVSALSCSTMAKKPGGKGPAWLSPYSDLPACAPLEKADAADVAADQAESLKAFPVEKADMK